MAETHVYVHNKAHISMTLSCPYSNHCHVLPVEAQVSSPCIAVDKALANRPQ